MSWIHGDDVERLLLEVEEDVVCTMSPVQLVLQFLNGDGVLLRFLLLFLTTRDCRIILMKVPRRNDDFISCDDTSPPFSNFVRATKETQFLGPESLSLSFVDGMFSLSLDLLLCLFLSYFLFGT
jgi:hypothetical protein